MCTVFSFPSESKTFARLGLKAIPMAADTGPIGGDLSHEFIIISNTGESDIYFDNKILNEGNKISDVSYDDDLNSIVEKFKSYYSASDEKHEKAKFDEIVHKEKQMNSKGIEVGHIFHFGTKYSEAMGAYVADDGGSKMPVHMGSHGIGVSRLIGAIIEASHDENGIIWGFVSGAESASAKYILEKRLKLKYPPLIAMEDAPDKPNPEGFIYLAKKLSNNKLGASNLPIAYVGDTIADVQTVLNARKKIPSMTSF